MVHVEIDHCHPRQAMLIEGMGRSTATLLKMQKPMAWLRVAWCPGGRQATKALRTSPAITRSTAITAPPAA